MPRFAICNELFEGWTWPTVLEQTTALGYTALELAPFTLAPTPTQLSVAQRTDLRRQVESAGSRVLGLHWLLAKTQGLHLTSPDAATRRRTAGYLADLAHLCRDVGGELMVLGSPQQRSLQPGVSVEAGLDYATQVLEQLLPTLEQTQVDLCLEPLGPAETNFLNSLAEAETLRRRLNHPRVRVHLDVKAMASEARPIPDLIRQYGGTARHFHANDPNRRGPGFGDCDFVPIFQALAASGYDQWISVEVFDYSPDPQTIAQKSIEYMRRCWPQAAKP